MARIPDADIQRLKDEVSVQRLIESAGVELFHFYYISVIMCFIVAAGERHGTSGHRG
jgi:hypothetical protein